MSEPAIVDDEESTTLTPAFENNVSIDADQINNKPDYNDSNSNMSFSDKEDSLSSNDMILDDGRFFYGSIRI